MIKYDKKIIFNYVSFENLILVNPNYMNMKTKSIIRRLQILGFSDEDSVLKNYGYIIFRYFLMILSSP